MPKIWEYWLKCLNLLVAMLDVSCFDFRDPQETDEDYFMCAFLYSFLYSRRIGITPRYCGLN